MANWMRTMTEQGLPDEFETKIVDTRIDNPKRRRDFSLSYSGEIRRSFRIMSEVLYHYAFTRPHIVHINVSTRHKLGMLRALVCAVLARICRYKVMTHYHGDISRMVVIPDDRGDGPRSA